MTKKYSFKVQERVIVFYSNSLLIELFMNCLESNDMTSIGNTPNGSMKMTSIVWKSILMYDL
jgi:hypothetical protein